MPDTTLRRYLALTAIGSLALPLSACVGASLIRRHIYLPDPLPPHLDWQEGVPAPELVTVRTEDGLAIDGYRWPATTSVFSTLIFFHGNAGNRHAAAIFAAPLRRSDTEVIVASYRGYGGNPGRPSEKGLYRDGAAFLRYARLSKPKHIYLFGFSLGAGVALRLAADHCVDGVVTLGAFSSLASVSPAWVRPLLPDHFDNIAAVRRLRAPFLLLHGTNDDTIPPAEAYRLERASTSSPRVVMLPNLTHDISLEAVAPMIWANVIQMTRENPVECTHHAAD